MIVGVKLGTVREEDREVLKAFIERHCFTYGFIANNIAKNAHRGLFLFTPRNTDTLDDSLPFIDEVVETKDGQCLLVSVTNAVVEIPLAIGGVIRLLPTEYFYVPIEDYNRYKFFIIRNILRCFMGEPIVNRWILATNFWRDNGIWIDTDVWND